MYLLYVSGVSTLYCTDVLKLQTINRLLSVLSTGLVLWYCTHVMLEENSGRCLSAANVVVVSLLNEIEKRGT